MKKESMLKIQRIRKAYDGIPKITLLAFLSNGCMLVFAVICISKNDWAINEATNKANETAISKVGLWKACWNYDHPCEESVQAIQYHLDNEQKDTPYWLFIVRLFAVLGNLSIGFGVLISLKILLDGKLQVCAGIAFIIVGNFSLMGAMGYFTYSITNLLPYHRWGYSFYIGWLSPACSFASSALILWCMKRKKKEKKETADERTIELIEASIVMI